MKGKWFRGGRERCKKSGIAYDDVFEGFFFFKFCIVTKQEKIYSIIYFLIILSFHSAVVSYHGQTTVFEAPTFKLPAQVFLSNCFQVSTRDIVHRVLIYIYIIPFDRSIQTNGKIDIQKD